MRPEDFVSSKYLPLDYYPWPNRVNPNLEQMRVDMDGWIDNDYTFLTPHQRSQYKKMRLHACTAWMWPDLTYEQAVPCNRFMLQYVVHDDQLEHSSLQEVQEQGRRCVAILRGEQPTPQENALYHHIALIRDEFRSIMPALWLDRFIDLYDYTFQYGIALEHSYKVAKTPPSLMLYKVIRDHSVLMRPYLVFGEIESGLVLPKHIFDHPIMQRMISLVCTLVYLQNDMHSLPKELAKGTEVFNMIFVLQQHCNMSFDEACDELLRIHNEYLAELLALHKEYREFGEYQEHVDKFLFYGGVGLQGVNTFYVRETARYSHGGAGFAWPEER